MESQQREDVDLHYGGEWSLRGIEVEITCEAKTEGQI